MRGQALTERQQEVLDHIREHMRKWGVPPSRTELTGSLEVSSGSAVAYHLQALDRKGWIQVNPGMDRGIQLLREGAPVFNPGQLPEAAAGTPTLADESKAIMRVPDELSRRIHPQADFYVVRTRRQHEPHQVQVGRHRRREAETPTHPTARS